MSSTNITITDTSPIFLYSPFGEGGQGEASATYGWATGYTSTGFLNTNGSLPRGDTGSGLSFHATAFEGASVSLTFNGTALYLVGAANCSYDVTLDLVTSTMQATTLGTLAAYENLSLQREHIINIQPHPGTDELFLLTQALVTIPFEGQLSNSITAQDERIVFRPSGSWGSPPDYGAPSPYHQIGASASLSFTGTSIAVYGGLDYGDALYTVSLDGSPSQTFNGSSYWNVNDTILYFQSNLVDGVSHNLQLFNSNPDANVSITQVITCCEPLAIPPMPTETSGNSPGSGAPHGNNPLGIILGVTIGALCFFAALLWFWWAKIGPARKRAKNSRGASAEDVVYAAISPSLLPEFNPYQSPQQGSMPLQHETQHSIPPEVPKRRALKLLIAPTFVLLAIIGLLAAMVVWLLINRIPHPVSTSTSAVGGGGLIVDEASKWCDIVDKDACNTELAPSLLGLTLSGLLSKAVSFSVPLILAMAILSAAATWIKTPDTSSTLTHHPTPLQYGLMVSMAAGNALTAWQSWKYLVHRRKSRTKAPPFVKSVFTSLVVLLSLSLVVSVADTWLHISTKPLKLNQTSLAPNTSSLLAGLALNPNACPNPTFAGTCVYEDPVAEWGTAAQRDLGDMVAANSSDAPYEVMYLAAGDGGDPTAILLPRIKNLPNGISFTSTSIGLGATCSVIPPSQCDLLALGTNYGTIDCTVDSAVPSAPEDDLPGGIFTVYANSTFQLDAADGAWVATYNLQDAAITGAPSTPLAWSGQNATNPFGFAHMMAFSAQPPQGNSDFIVRQSSTAAASDATIAFYIGSCNISVYDVQLSFSNNAYALVNRTLADQDTTVAMFGPFVSDYFYESLLSGLIVHLKPVVSDDSSSTTFPAAVAGQISQMGLAYSSAMFESLGAQDGTLTQSYIASRYPLAPLGLLWASAALYVLYSSLLLARAVVAKGDEVVTSGTTDEGKTTTKTISALELAQVRLINPIALVADRFNESDAHAAQRIGDAEHSEDMASLSVKTDPLDMFADGGEKRRLGVGFSSAIDGTEQSAQRRVFRVARLDSKEREQPTGYKDS
ncbi:hypothetical protein FRB98_006617 [Tulasnella sp. 332]|nr:hypothetical protein FRB98_006617 [Tulasnella sp. 332]